MKEVFLVFSDEAGHIKKKNYYCRICLLIDPENYKKLSENFFSLKSKYNIPLDKEFKFSYLWQLKKHKNYLNEKKDSYYFKDYKTEELENFIKENISYLAEINIKIIVVYTYFLVKPHKNIVEIEHDFLKTIMIRLEYEFSQNKALGIIFYDESNNKKEISEAYRRIFINKEYVKEYSHLKDSLSFDLSTYSAGIQIADLVSGITHGFLRDYNFSSNLFQEFIKINLRKVSSYTIEQTGFIPLYLTEDNGKEIVKKIKQQLEQ